MNRPEFLLRQFEFYELMDSPHPIYILDSSNEENAEKLKEGIKRFKKLRIVYKWAPPGKDSTFLLSSLIEEKYCIQMGDDDLIIPKTISDCADFLENNPDYATCAGKQVNIRLRREDHNKPYGKIERAALPHGRSFEEEDMSARAKNFWSGTNYICFSVRRTELERAIRNVTRHFYLNECIMEFLLWSILIISGKSKVLDKLGYIMQISEIRTSFTYGLVLDFLLSPAAKEKWDIGENGLSEILQGRGMSKEEGHKMAKGIFIFYLARQFTFDADSLYVDSQKHVPVKKDLSKKIRYFASGYLFFKKVYYKFKTPQDVTRPESKYFNDFKVVKDFLEKDR